MNQVLLTLPDLRMFEQVKSESSSVSKQGIDDSGVLAVFRGVSRVCFCVSPFDVAIVISGAVSYLGHAQK
jgi:hypothetical protein